MPTYVCFTVSRKTGQVGVGWAKTRKRCAQQERAWTERKKFWEHFLIPTYD